MIFNSLTFLIFLPISLIIYWCSGIKYRALVIFCLSLIFYGFWRFEFIFLILLSTSIDYFIALKIPSVSKKKKKILLISSIFFNLFILFTFKYLNFFLENFFNFAILFGFNLDPFLLKIVLPLGISFYTFQTISYTIDVYRENIKPEKNFLVYASYVTFFPQLIAGPILRAGEIIPQFKSKLILNADNLYMGLKRIIFGIFLKVALADNISFFVDEGFSISTNNLSAIDVWTIAFLFGFQIYFDFSAYSHIAIGTARLFGINFPENFNFPYFSDSPKTFWKRWHISLSSWIRDYLYLPLLGMKNQNSSQKGISISNLPKKSNKALFITWSLMGLWHGANWTFLIWGIFHAFVIFSYRLASNLNIKFYKPIYGCLLTLPIMMLGWIPFRSQSINDTLNMYKILFDIDNYFNMNMRENSYLVCAVIMLGHTVVYFINQNYKKIQNNLGNLNEKLIEFVFISSLIIIILIYLRPVNQFIYFQF